MQKEVKLEQVIEELEQQEEVVGKLENKYQQAARAQDEEPGGAPQGGQQGAYTRCGNAQGTLVWNW